MDVDPTNLTLTIKPQATATAVLSANADLWTANAGINQDLGIDVAGVGYPTLPGQPEAWKESGGGGRTPLPPTALPPPPPLTPPPRPPPPHTHLTTLTTHTL